MKAGFWDKHGERLEAAAHKYIQQKIRQRVLLEVSMDLSLPPFVDLIKLYAADQQKVETLLRNPPDERGEEEGTGGDPQSHVSARE